VEENVTELDLARTAVQPANPNKSNQLELPGA
jgi:hypothetical protein